ncbi:MAG: Cyclic nucleotide-binding protein [Fibrobacteres bacterium]|nr:Cyclic nucleotide-binding protein [Fibrobacterota bacterium]
MQWPKLCAAIEGLVPVADAEYAAICSDVRPRRLSKTEHLFTHGDVCRWVGFVNEGCLRYYLVDDKAEERVPQHYIASFLGIKPQSLSRIRKKLALEGPGS